MYERRVGNEIVETAHDKRKRILKNKLNEYEQEIIDLIQNFEDTHSTQINRPSLLYHARMNKIIIEDPTTEEEEKRDLELFNETVSILSSLKLIHVDTVGPVIE